MGVCYYDFCLKTTQKSTKNRVFLDFVDFYPISEKRFSFVFFESL